jgi:hypothetical protein
VSEAPISVVEVADQDDVRAVERSLDQVDTRRVALVLPWDQGVIWREVDLVVLRRAAVRRGLELAVISADPERRGLARRGRLAAFGSLGEARRVGNWRVREEKAVRPPPARWWNPPPLLRPRRARVWPIWLRWVGLAVRLIVFLGALGALAGGAYSIVPRAAITLVPAGEEFRLIVPVHATRDVAEVDAFSRMVPARPVGLEIDGYLEVPTTGELDVALGRTSGAVLFTNVLLQDYTVPAGTVVRTSSTSYPIRFQTTEEVRVPAGGQASVGIESLADGVGNIAAYQINQVEGIAGSAVRVTNPEDTSGSDATEVRVVTQADRDRARELLIRRVLDDAHYQLSSPDMLEAGELIPRQSLVIQAVPKEAYTRFIGEQAGSVGLELRLLVSGLAVDIEKARVVAQTVLEEQLPDGYALVHVWFDVGEIAEEDIGPGEFTIFVTAHGYASAELDTEAAIEAITGARLDEAKAQLAQDLPLAQPPQIVLWPDMLERMPALPMRISVHILPFRGAPASEGLASQ